MHHMEHNWTMVMLKICKHTFYTYLSRIWKMMQFTGFIRKVFVTKILLSGKFSFFVTLVGCNTSWVDNSLQKWVVRVHWIGYIGFFAYWVGRLVDGKTIFRASKLFPQVSWLRHPLIPNAVPDLLTVSIYTPSALLSFCKARETF